MGLFFFPRHPLYEVETTLVPQTDCSLRDDKLDNGQRKESLSTMSLTKVCTAYIPHQPSTYNIDFDAQTGGKGGGVSWGEWGGGEVVTKTLHVLSECSLPN